MSLADKLHNVGSMVADHRLWEVRPTFLWLIGPGVRSAFRCSFHPLRLEPLDFLPEAKRLGWPGRTGEVPAQIPGGPA